MFFRVCDKTMSLIMIRSSKQVSILTTYIKKKLDIAMTALTIVIGIVTKIIWVSLLCSCYLVYKTQLNSASCACWLASSPEVTSKHYSPLSSWMGRSQEFNFHPFFGILIEFNYIFDFFGVYTKATIYLSVSEISGYLSPLQWLIVNF